MSEQVDLDTLRTVPYLAELSEQELQKISSIAKMEDHPADSIIFKQGSPESRIFFVLSGLVGLELQTPNNGSLCIQTIGRGELLGWTPLLSETPMTASARVLRDSRVVALDAAKLLDLCRQDCQLGCSMMRKTAQALAKRLNATRQHMLHAHLHNLPVLPAELFEGAD